MWAAHGVFGDTWLGANSCLRTEPGCFIQSRCHLQTAPLHISTMTSGRVWGMSKMEGGGGWRGEPEQSKECIVEIGS